MFSKNFTNCSLKVIAAHYPTLLPENLKKIETIFESIINNYIRVCNIYFPKQDYLENGQQLSFLVHLNKRLESDKKTDIPNRNTHYLMTVFLITVFINQIWTVDGFFEVKVLKYLIINFPEYIKQIIAPKYLKFDYELNDLNAWYKLQPDPLWAEIIADMENEHLSALDYQLMVKPIDFINLGNILQTNCAYCEIKVAWLLTKHIGLDKPYLRTRMPEYINVWYESNPKKLIFINRLVDFIITTKQPPVVIKVVIFFIFYLLFNVWQLDNLHLNTNISILNNCEFRNSDLLHYLINNQINPYFKDQTNTLSIKNNSPWPTLNDIMILRPENFFFAMYNFAKIQRFCLNNTQENPENDFQLFFKVHENNKILSSLFLA